MQTSIMNRTKCKLIIRIGGRGSMYIGKMASRQTEKQSETKINRQAPQLTDGCKTYMTDGRWMGGRTDGRTDDGQTDG